MAEPDLRERAPRTFCVAAANFHHTEAKRREGNQCVNDTFAILVVARALVQSYPTWTDEHGTNVEQLAVIAVSALAEHSLLAEPQPDTVPAAGA